jgi:hypothetical protein
MTVLAWKNEIILASGQKGSNSYMYDTPETEVLMSLQRCQATWLEGRENVQNARHRKDGKCAEQMGAHLYYLAPSTIDSGKKLPDQNARIGTVVFRKALNRPVQQEPCGKDKVVSHQYYHGGLFQHGC